MAIDQEIQRKVDAYRSNPQALQQRYAQNQQLIDLLALQKLKSEKDAAAKQMQLQMAQNPQTIKQQRERELLDRTKQEMMQQQAGIMQTAQQRQQQNMQRVANQGMPPSQRAQPKGLGSLGGQQRPPVARMAGGGIVAFQEGGATTYPGGITQADVEEYKRKNAGQLGGKTDLEIAKLLAIYASRRKRIGEATAPLEEGSRATGTGGRTALGGRGFEFPDIGIDSLKDLLARDNAKWAERDQQAAGPESQPAGTQPEPQSGSVSSYPIGESELDAGVEPQLPAQGAASQTRGQAPAAAQSGVSGIGTLTAPKIDLSNVGQMGESILERVGLGSIQDPDAARAKRMDEAADYMGRQRVADRMQDYLKQLGALDAQQTDPAKLRREEILAGLRGAANTGSFGGAMAGVSRGMAEERKAQEKSQRDRLLKTIELDQAAMGLDIDMAKTGLAEGRSAYEQVNNNRRIVAQVLANTRTTEVQAAMKRAEMQYNADKDNIKNTLEKMQIDATNGYRRAVAASDARTAALQILQNAVSDMNKVISKKEENSEQIITAKARLKTLSEQSNPDPEEVKKAKAGLAKAREVVYLEAQRQFELSGVLGIVDDLKAIVDGNDGATPATEATYANWGEMTVTNN